MQNYNLKIKIIIILLILFNFSFSIFNLSEASAQTIDPLTWQTSATGLSVNQNNNRTGGLGFIVENKGWPFLSTQGGVENANSWVKPSIRGNIGIELGEVKIPNASNPLLGSENFDWAHNELTFNNSNSPIKLWVSRLTPGILVNSASNILRLFSGVLLGNEVFTNQYNQPDIRSISRTSSPKYIAFPSQGNTSIQTLTTANTALPSSTNWLLLWYGSNSHFADTKTPLLRTGADLTLADTADLPIGEAYQADIPILLIFSNSPSSISQSPEGGVDIDFSSSANYVTILPLYGRNHLKASDTENWGQQGSLPQDTQAKINFWNQNLCNFPTTVSESYNYNQNSDTSTITENVSFIDVCNGRTLNTFAPLPTFLAISNDALNVQFSGTVTDGNLPTEFGPVMGIQNSSSYSFSISGLKKYTDSQRILGNGTIPDELTTELTDEVTKIISSNHYAPWVWVDNIPRGDTRGDIYFLNPADSLYNLTEVVSSLPDGQTKTDLINYIKSEKTNYPPEDIANLSLSEGTYRKYFALDNTHQIFSQNSLTRWNNERQDVFLNRVHLFSFYGLSRYYEVTAEQVPPTLIQKAQNTLNLDIQQQDWATMYWFNGFNDRSVAVINSNRYLAGLIGLIKLSQKAQNTELEALGRSLLAKAAIQRAAMALYTQYLYSVSLVELPIDPAWQPNYSSRFWRGLLFNYNWTGVTDDPRQVSVLNQFGLTLLDHAGYADTGLIVSPFLSTFRDMTPETFRFLSDYAKQSADTYISKTEALFPHWYAAYSEGTLGSEHNMSHPIDSFQIFMAKALIQKDTPTNLRKYRDISWLENGDLFYVQKLAETIKAYRGWSWSDPPGGGQVHCTPLGDIDCSGKVNVLDLSTLINKFGGSDVSADLDNSGKVNVIDLSILLSNFGRTL